jgi:hypothetical protein
MEFRYCQTCGKRNLMPPSMEGSPYQPPPPCVECFGTAYGPHPKKHSWVDGWRLSAEDVEFLRVQRIDPEVGP